MISGPRAEIEDDRKRERTADYNEKCDEARNIRFTEVS